MSELDDLEDCVVTFEQTKAELEGLEQQLAARLGVTGDIETVRAILMTMDCQGVIVEDELVADWHCAYSSYVDWLRHSPELAATGS